MVDKFRGKISVTFEVLKDIIKISDNDNAEIIDVIRTNEDRLKDTFSIILASNGETRYTKKVTEGSSFPEVYF